MKTLLRPSLLIAAFALVAFATAGHAFADGICHVLCRNPTTHQITTANGASTEAACCNGTFNPCPAGYNAGSPTYSPPNPPGGLIICPA
jgi:hypothetical protein